MQIRFFFVAVGAICLLGALGCDSMQASDTNQNRTISSVPLPPTPGDSPSPSPFPSAPVVLFSDNYSNLTENQCLGDRQHIGLWELSFSGYGCIRFVSTGIGNAILEAPKVSKRPSETHAALMLGPVVSGDAVYQVSMKTIKQLRTGSAPNTWEVAWFLWNFTDGSHFYSINLKPNGWELDKEDPAYLGNQRFLATGTSPAFPIGQWYDVKVVQIANRINIYVDGKMLASATDNERPYDSGAIGLYNEDSEVTFGPVQVTRP